jgi:hypothetical protein
MLQVNILVLCDLLVIMFYFKDDLKSQQLWYFILQAAQ